jgi:ABC-type protease/lipase transport system fused ATPase/permease subunit
MISWKNVEIKIRTTQILDHINFELKKGESLGIVGNNGTGKTVLAKALAGSIPVQGDINTDFFELPAWKDSDFGELINLENVSLQ